MRLAEPDEHLGHRGQEVHWTEAGLVHSLVVDNCGKVLEDSLDAVAAVEPAHSGEGEEGKRTVADHPDQPGLEVDHARHTTWAGVGRSALDRLVRP